METDILGTAFQGGMSIWNFENAWDRLNILETIPSEHKCSPASRLPKSV